MSYLLMQTFRKSLSQAICKRLRHDCVVIVVIGPELIAEVFQPNSACHRERADVIRQPGLLRSDEVCERSARFTALPIGLLAKKMKSLEHGLAFRVRV